VLTLGGVWPLAHRARDYYFINNHSFGGKRFATKFAGWSIYKIYLISLGLLFLAAVTSSLGASLFGFLLARGQNGVLASNQLAIGMSVLTLSVTWVAVASYVYTRVFNLARSAQPGPIVR